MELLQLRYFQKVAELESITHAANYYLIPQSSMSQTIARLEKELNVKLFDRRSSKLFLNEHGQKFLVYVRRILQDLDDGIAEVTGNTPSISGLVRIKVMENHRFVLRCVSEFAKLYPDVSVSVSHGYYDDPETIHDLCISSLTAYKQMTTATPLTRERIVLAVYENHPFAQRESVEIPDLKGEKLISLPPQSYLNSITLSLCRSHGFEPLVPIIYDDPYFIRKCVSDEIGIALAPSLSWKGLFLKNTVLIPIENPPIYASSYLVWDNTRFSSPAVHKFSAFLLEKAHSLPDNLIFKT